MATVDEGSWGPAILGLTIAFLVLVILALFLRIFTRVWIVHSFWWDDFTIILAVVCKASPRSNYQLAHILVAWDNYRCRSRLRRSTLWLWQAPTIS